MGIQTVTGKPLSRLRESKALMGGLNLKLTGKETVYAFEISQLDRYILMGLLSKVINKEELGLDDELTEKIKGLLAGLVKEGN